MKTIKELLKKLPLQKRLQAIEIVRKRTGLAFLETLVKKEELISTLFIWEFTKQGHEYWENIQREYNANS